MKGAEVLRRIVKEETSQAKGTVFPLGHNACGGEEPMKCAVGDGNVEWVQTI